ncbi:hypothetical protein RDI58_017718 [Solanum bulbocastanum]|uniref:Uncharacterized protein n=1 Tax=Solanum bulbocastanum TaxID=147425 RepID=A0AAN8TCU7_SOLBU
MAIFIPVGRSEYCALEEVVFVVLKLPHVMRHHEPSSTNEHELSKTTKNAKASMCYWLSFGIMQLQWQVV